MGGTYRVVTNDFLARGGDGFSTLKNNKGTDTGLIDADVFADYLRLLGTVDNPTDQRVTVLTAIAGYRSHAMPRLLRFPEVIPTPFRKAA